MDTKVRTTFMDVIKSFIKQNFEHFAYFYSHLGSRILLSLVVSLSVGLLDGFGLAMFLPLLQMADGQQTEVDSEQLGNLSFLVEGMQSIGLELNLNTVLLIILFFFSFKGIMKFLEGYLQAIYQQYFIKNIRLRNVEYLSNFSYNQFVNADSGRIQNTFGGEVERVNQAYKSYFMAVQYAVLVFVYIVLAFMANPQFAILITVGGVVTNFVFKAIYKMTKKLSKKLTAQTHLFQGLLIQKVTYFKYLKATSLIQNYAAKLKHNITQIEQSQKKIGVLNALLQAIREPVVMLVVVVVILVQVRFFSESLGLIILSLLFFYRALTFLMGVQNYSNVFLSMSGSLNNMTRFAAELKEGREENGSEVFDHFQSDLKLEGVSFAYGDQKVLDNVDLDIQKDETVAIIGESGSGKTTLMNILTGLIRPTEGNMLIDGRSCKEWDMRTFQKRIGYITQEPVIFNDTVYNNVTFWAEKTEENLAKFYSALQKAAVYDFVMSMDKKEDAMLGNNGINISGGQKQRISIARELYKDVDFLFMDEATSALDAETERLIKENIDYLKGKYTIVIIAHRLSTIKNADRLIVLSNGKVDKTGSFEELFNKSASFKQMVSL